MSAMDEDWVLKQFEQVWQTRPDEGIRILRDYLRSRPKSVRVRFRLAGLYEAKYGEGVAGAARIYREILAEDAENVACLTALALLQESPGFHLPTDERIDLLAKAARLSGDPVAIRNLAFAAWEFGRPERALEAFEHLKSVATTSGKAHLLRTADTCIAEIRSGSASSSTSVYSIPEAWLGRHGSSSADPS